MALGRSNNATSGQNKSRDLSQKFLFWGCLDEHLLTGAKTETALALNFFPLPSHTFHLRQTRTLSSILSPPSDKGRLVSSSNSKVYFFSSDVFFVKSLSQSVFFLSLLSLRSFPHLRFAPHFLWCALFSPLLCPKQPWPNATSPSIVAPSSRPGTSSGLTSFVVVVKSNRLRSESRREKKTWPRGEVFRPGMAGLV